MSLHDSRILTALIRAKAQIARGRLDTRDCWTGVICPSCGHDYRSVTGVGGGPIDDQSDQDKARKLAMDTRKTSKAGSAESILRHCLRSLGLTASYRKGDLSVSDHVNLLEEIRQYGRSWLRHEAEGFVRSYIEKRSLERKGVGRAISWMAGSGGHLIQQDSGFRHAVGRFFNRAKQFIRELALSSALALFGPTPLTGEELSAIDRETQKQDQFFDAFQQKILSPPDKLVTQPIDVTSQVITLEPTPMTPGQFVAAAERYADSSWQIAQRLNRITAVGNPAYTVERRVLGTPKTEHCGDCPPLADLGWQPIGTLPDIGDTECGSLCLCHFRYSSGQDSPEFIQGSQGALRAPSEATILDDDGSVQMVAEPPGGLTDKFPIAGPP